jgi:hypothetical protein
MKVRLLILYSLIYGLTAVGFCIYWATNFIRHTTYKGDEFFMLAQFLLVLTYLFLLTIQLTVKKVNFLLVFSLPLMICVASFCIGLVILYGTGLSGIPRHYILIYGLLYGLISLLAVYKFWGQTEKNS